MTAEPTFGDIRRVALELFAAQGYDGTSVRDIADGVGIRAASMYHHFASKEEILWDLTRSALAQLHHEWRRSKVTMSDADEPESRLGAFVRASVLFHAETRAASTLVNSQLHRLAPHHYSAAVKLRHAYQEELEEIVEACLATGRHDVPDVQLTVFAILQMTAAIASWYDPAGRLSIEELADVYEALALKMLAVPARPPAGT